jgi:hypothetical protein
MKRPLVGALLAVSAGQRAISLAGDPEPPDDLRAARPSAGEPLPSRGTRPIGGEGLRRLASADGRPTVGSGLGLPGVASLALVGFGVAVPFGVAARSGRRHRGAEGLEPPPRGTPDSTDPGRLT